jgi:hypothetical protein
MFNPARTLVSAAVTFVLPAALLAPASNSFGVILYRSAQRNTSAPSGALANSGWQWQGQFGSFLGTAIAPQYFITAQHIGGAPSFNYNGTSYNLDTSFGGGTGYMDGPGSDLRIWKVLGSLPNWAPLYDANTEGTEVGRTMIVFGRGASRGDEVYAQAVTGGGNQGSGGTSGDIGGDGFHPGELKGWRWANFDSVQSWGTNIVSGIFDGGPNFGQLVGFDFDRNGLFDEGALAAGDSGGGLFVQSGGAWKLAGVNLGVDGPWSYSETGPGFDASLFDAGGLYFQPAENQWQYIPDQLQDIPATSYSSRISSSLGWIRGIVGATGSPDVPEPASMAAALLAGSVLCVRRRRRR